MKLYLCIVGLGVLGVVSGSATALASAPGQYLQFADCTFVHSDVGVTDESVVYPEIQVYLSQWGIGLRTPMKQDGLLVVTVEGQLGGPDSAKTKFNITQPVTLNNVGDGSGVIQVESATTVEISNQIGFSLPLQDDKAMASVAVTRKSDGAQLSYSCKQVAPITD